MDQRNQLIKTISEANAAYVANIPFLTDTEYDELWKALYSIDPENPILYHTTRNPNIRAGMVHHKYRIYGLPKAFNILDLSGFFTRFGAKPIVIEPKYDGCAGVLTQTSSGLQLALSGDGIDGLNITRHLPKIELPTDRKHFDSVEIIIPWSAWNAEMGANPRNAVSGWMNRHKSDFPDGVVQIVSHNYGPLSKSYEFDGDSDALFELLLSTYAKWAKIYPMDGLVIKVASEKDRLIAGHTESTFAWAIAWKPPISVKDTTVTELEWNISRNGRDIPTVIYDPISLCGTTNVRATGNNARWILDRNIKVGSRITVGKAGEIIPKIINVVNDSPELTQLPSTCHVCGSTLSWEGVHLVCHSDKCIAKLIKRLHHFYNDKNMYLLDVGEVLIESLLLDKACYDILSVTPWALLDMEAYDLFPEVYRVLGSTMAMKIHKNAGQLNLNRDPAHFIAGLGKPGVGYKTARDLLNYIATGKLSRNISAAVQTAFVEGLKEFTEAKATMKNFSFAKLPSPATLTYAITGTLFDSRDNVIDLLKIRLNWDYHPAVTKAITYLIVGDEPGKTKLTKAAKYGKQILTQDQLLTLLNEAKHDN